MTGSFAFSMYARTLSGRRESGKPPARRNGGPRTADCAVCFPCLVRRSGLLQANGADGTQHEALPRANGLPFDRRADWPALQRWLLGRYTLTDVLTETPLPPDVDPAMAFDLIRGGREELIPAPDRG